MRTLVAFLVLCGVVRGEYVLTSFSAEFSGLTGEGDGGAIIVSFQPYSVGYAFHGDPFEAVGVHRHIDVDGFEEQAFNGVAFGDDDGQELVLEIFKGPNRSVVYLPAASIWDDAVHSFPQGVTSVDVTVDSGLTRPASGFPAGHGYRITSIEALVHSVTWNVVDPDYPPANSADVAFTITFWGVPEPSTLATLLTGCCIVFGVRRR